MSMMDAGSPRGAGGPMLGSQRGGEQMPGPRTATERDSGFTVLMQAFIGLGRAGLAGDAALMARFRSIVMQVQDIMSRARAETVAGQQPRDHERQDGVPRPVGPTGAPM